MFDLEERRYILEDAVKKLDSVNKKIAKLTLEKEALTKEIISALGHEKEGQITYPVGHKKVTCKTPMIYSLDKKAYESGDIYLPSEFDPIKKCITYSVDKKLCEQYMATSPKSAREALFELITKKPGKPSVTII